MSRWQISWRIFGLGVTAFLAVMFWSEVFHGFWDAVMHEPWQFRLAFFTIFGAMIYVIGTCVGDAILRLFTDEDPLETYERDFDL